MKRYNIIFTSIFLPPLFLLSVSSYGADDFHGRPIHLLESAFQSAPKKVHWIADTLNKKISPGQGYALKHVVFEGDTGVGKSTLGCALAYKTNRGVIHQCATDFITRDGRNNTSASLNSFLRNVWEADGKHVVIIDEIDQLAKHYNSPHHDTDASSKALWNFLDKLQTQDNLFLVCTTNDVTGYPPQLRSRLAGAKINIPRWNDGMITEINLIKMLEDESVVLTQEAIDYIRKNIKEHEAMVARDIFMAANMIKGEAYISPKQKSTIKAIHVKNGFAILRDSQGDFDKPSQKDEEHEQRERHHIETMKQSERHHLNTNSISTVSYSYLPSDTVGGGMRSRLKYDFDLLEPAKPIANKN